jgi:hypothetical protein
VTDVEVRHDRPLAIHQLVYLADGDEVTIGRPDIDSYAIFPEDGAELVRRLAAGASPEEAGRWYEDRYGERVDLDHVLAALGELGFLADPGGPGTDPTGGSRTAAAAPPPLRWCRLGRVLLSPAALTGYAVLLGWAVLAMFRRPELVPTYHDVFFTQYYSLIEALLLVATVPLILLHESFHALAGRRLGLRSRLRISRRLYFLVAETALDGLVMVPRRKRYLPILAGMLVDLVAVAVLVIVADLTRQPSGALSLPGRVCLAVAFTSVIRVSWQFLFYLRTDLYALVATVLGCVDLHTTARRLLANRANRLLRRRHRLLDETAWHPTDRRVARWYSWLILVGYTTSLATFLFALWPTTYHLFWGAISRFTGQAQGSQLLDSAVFLSWNLIQVSIVVALAIRERHSRVSYRHVIA